MPLMSVVAKKICSSHTIEHLQGTAVSDGVGKMVHASAKAQMAGVLLLIVTPLAVLQRLGAGQILALLLPKTISVQATTRLKQGMCTQG